MTRSDARAFPASVRRLGNGLVLGGAIAAAALTVAAAVALFVMVGRRSQRWAEAAAPSTRPALPAGLSDGTEGGDAT